MLDEFPSSESTQAFVSMRAEGMRMARVLLRGSEPITSAVPCGGFHQGNDKRRGDEYGKLYSGLGMMSSVQVLGGTVVDVVTAACTNRLTPCLLQP